MIHKHTLFWSGKNRDECYFFGVGFMIKTSIARKLQNLPVVPKSPNPGQEVCHCPQCVCTYSQAETVVKEAAYHDLDNPLQQVDSKDKLLILGDFNTRVG